ncbi:hypothetical protein MB27_41115 [Actinoplanes utahensis]|uniref:Uncharacterized protein n=1 Tax=Actinoplanes utahensis TaxID=1869 RepID=A0A0A6UDF5_ACTUT|nr:hypothetical protein MB27_41115 [Actinoplanes utahensis]
MPSPLPDGEVIVHEVLAAETLGYQPRAEVWTGDTERIGLRLTPEGTAWRVERLPVIAGYPRHESPNRLFVVRQGETARYRANFRFLHTTCPCDPSWYYESWTVHIGHGRDLSAAPDHDVDHRTHLYGGSTRPRRARLRSARH